eukprot:7263581-Pyramimonas_sp.AAC.1
MGGDRLPSCPEKAALQIGLDEVYGEWCDRAWKELEGTLQCYPEGLRGGSEYTTVDIPLGELL